MILFILVMIGLFKKKKVRDDRDDMSILESYITLSPLKWFNLMLEFLFL